jgi:hypothetical protein
MEKKSSRRLMQNYSTGAAVRVPKIVTVFDSHRGRHTPPRAGDNSHRIPPVLCCDEIMTAELNDIRGLRGEAILEVCLTEYRDFPKPLFRPGFLGDKWPAIDFYVELLNVAGRTPYFFAQAKATGSTLSGKAHTLRISAKKEDIQRLLRLPGPTYLFGVHEPSKRVFVRSVHRGTPIRAMTRIPLAYELTTENLKVLHNEVKSFWRAHGDKPSASAFA